jgi:hypothetical protein
MYHARKKLDKKIFRMYLTSETHGAYQMRRLPFWPNYERLPLLAEAHPDAANGSGVALGLQTVPIEAIHGTVSSGHTQRDRRFMPRGVARNGDWQRRWERLQEATRTQAILPPVDLLQVGDGYWVVDGHNRIALARSVGQLDVDANVTALRRAGSPEIQAERSRLTPLIEEGTRLRAAVRARA